VWIADVVPFATIQSLWGNQIRDRVVHDFASKAERDAHPLPNGSVCITLDSNIVYVKNNAGVWWVLEMPYREPFTPRAWTSPAGDGSNLMEHVVSSTTIASWKQSLGHASVSMVFTYTGQVFGVDRWVYAYTPAAIAEVGVCGTALAIVSASGLSSGGAAQWHASVAPGSRFILLAGGQKVPPQALVVHSSAPPTVTVQAQLSYRCDPAIDTP
jgi:hypothetical protein